MLTQTLLASPRTEVRHSRRFERSSTGGARYAQGPNPASAGSRAGAAGNPSLTAIQCPALIAPFNVCSTSIVTVGFEQFDRWGASRAGYKSASADQKPEPKAIPPSVSRLVCTTSILTAFNVSHPAGNPSLKSSSVEPLGYGFFLPLNRSPDGLFHGSATGKVCVRPHHEGNFK
jgi:hypothetical protein